MKKMDKLIFWGVLTVSFLFLMFSNVIFQSDGGKQAVIEVDGKPYASYQMQELRENKTLKVKTEYGTHTIEINDKSICVTSTDCNNKACLGEIENIGEMLVCLPGKLVIKISGEQEVDGVAY